ncbi:MAG: Nucleotidyltransferase domain protein, partial [Candidatus Woesebacteria bacterium GW2011_GWC2_31_9]
MAYTKDEVLKVIKKFRKEIEGLVHTDGVYLFGSYATGHAKDYSDIDIAIVSADINDENYFDMKSKIFKK